MRFLAKLLFRSSCAMFLFTLTSCAGFHDRQAAIDRLTTLSVDDSVVVPESATYVGPENPFGEADNLNPGNIIGAVKGDQITEYLRKNHIQVSEIVRREFIETLNQDYRFKGKVTQSGDARFVLVINEYGLYESHLFSFAFEPRIDLRVELIDKNGRVLWKQVSSGSLLFEQPPTARIETYFATPDEFRKNLAIAADRSSKELLRRINFNGYVPQ